MLHARLTPTLLLGSIVKQTRKPSRIAEQVSAGAVAKTAGRTGSPMASTEDGNERGGAATPDDAPADARIIPPQVKRRRFLDTALGLTGAAAFGSTVYPVTKYFTPITGSAEQAGMVTVAPLVSFPPNTAKTVQMGDEPVIVVRDKAGKFHALSAVCTHLGCVLGYDTASNLLACACHHGTFALSGQPLSGPPPRPLRAFGVSVIGENVVLVSSS